jgi:2-polyprenyl-3-methyl-5-hydroxy-6-metoxy-1,4-benzoquinol methylase
MIKSTLTGKALSTPIYKSVNDKSITSLSRINESPSVVYFEEEIAHLQTQEPEHVEQYYDEQYDLYNQSEEEDILYKTEGDKKIYRQQHQIETLLAKTDMKPGTKILDYGCAKGTVMKRLLERRSDITAHLFDVSKMYEHLWQRFLTPSQYASYQTPKEWEGQMDIVTSFFAFEHMTDPVKELKAIRKLLKDNGLVYLIVPNVFDNIADFIVSDHTHHYSQVSLRYILLNAGFEVKEIDPSSHFGAYIAIGKKAAADTLEMKADPDELSAIKKDCLNIAAYWHGLQEKITAFEAAAGNGRAAIYGAGVYGNFIATSLKNLSQVDCFVDQNDLLRNEKILGKPVYGPKDLPAGITHVYVGLNPKIAKNVIEEIGAWKGKNLKFMYL